MLPTSRNQPTPDDRRSPTVPPPCDQAAFQEAANVRACPPYLDCASPLGSCPRGGDHRGRASPDSQGGTGDTTSCSASSSTVPSRQPRTTLPRARPAPTPILAGGSSARTGYASRGSIGQGLDRLAVPGRPMRSLVARETGNAVRRPRPDGTADPAQEP